MRGKSHQNILMAPAMLRKRRPLLGFEEALNPECQILGLPFLKYGRFI